MVWAAILASRFTRSPTSFGQATAHALLKVAKIVPLGKSEQTQLRKSWAYRLPRLLSVAGQIAGVGGGQHMSNLAETSNRCETSNHCHDSNQVYSNPPH